MEQVKPAGNEIEFKEHLKKVKEEVLRSFSRLSYYPNDPATRQQLKLEIMMIMNKYHIMVDFNVVQSTKDPTRVECVPMNEFTKNIFNEIAKIKL